MYWKRPVLPAAGLPNSSYLLMFVTVPEALATPTTEPRTSVRSQRRSVVPVPSSQTTVSSAPAPGT
ncbi:MAG: hypothetical protein ABL957_15630 [Parvularculaceae bacterium]